MPRPSKNKRVEALPRYQEFSAVEAKGENQLQLLVEEYETIRLIDYLGMTQEECAAFMQIGRATVQSLYTAARGKLARFLVEGADLKIFGGSYELGNEEEVRLIGDTEKAQETIILAIPVENGQVFQHFGRARQFKLYGISQGKVRESYLLDSGEYSRRMLAELLRQQKVRILICGGIGTGARNALGENGIRVYAGARGEADTQVESFLLGGGIKCVCGQCLGGQVQREES